MNQDMFTYRFMTDEMMEARHQYTRRNKDGCTFGNKVNIYLPVHGDMNCYCEACTTYRISQGREKIHTITLPNVIFGNENEK